MRKKIFFSMSNKSLFNTTQKNQLAKVYTKLCYIKFSVFDFISILILIKTLFGRKAQL